VGSKAQREASYSQHEQSFNFVSVEGRGRRHTDTLYVTGLEHRTNMGPLDH
jgi:hypothetical protein